MSDTTTGTNSPLFGGIEMTCKKCVPAIHILADMTLKWPPQIVLCPYHSLMDEMVEALGRAQIGCSCWRYSEQCFKCEALAKARAAKAGGE